MEIHKRNVWNVAEEKNAVKKTERYNAFATRRRLFLGWAKWAKNVAKPTRINKAKSDGLYNETLSKKALAGWLSFMVSR